MNIIFCFTLLMTTIPIFATGSFENNEHFNLLKKGTIEYVRTRKAPEYFLKALETFQFPGLLRKNMADVYSSPSVCYYCNLVTDLLVGGRKLGMSRDTLVEEIKFFCTHLGIESDRVCSGVVELNVDVFVYIMDNYDHFTPDRFCGSFLQGYGCSPGSQFNWTINVANGNSPKRPKPAGTKDNSLKILHLSDIHYDPEYTPNGNAACGEPLCCQSDQGEPDGPKNTCGYWSDYRDADAPWHLVEETIRQAKTKTFDYVYFTGDIVAHRVWETSVEKNAESISKVFSYFKESFDVPVFVTFGNHEPHPVNVWTPSDIEDKKFDSKWLFQLAAKSWTELIGQNVSETVLKGGYYSVSPQPGLRIIAVNSNVGYTENWWLMYEDFDPFHQLQWLADTLKQAEDNGESVHIISHIPNGDGDSLNAWLREYVRIIERFANTITAQFNGHSHNDEFRVYYNTSDATQAINVAHNGASVTPGGYKNPSYKYFYVDKKTFDLLDFEEWTFNMTLANTQPTKPVDWYKLYSFVEAYGIDSMLPEQVDTALKNMARNHTLIRDYHKFKNRNVDRINEGGCDENCERQTLCSIVTPIPGQNTQCTRFQTLYGQA